MTGSRKAARVRAMIVLVAALAVGGVVSAAANDSGRAETGRVETTAWANSGSRSLFQASCGSCHKLKDAGTKGTAGPNLDKRFEDVSPKKIKRITKRAIVNGDESMPAGILTGRKAKKVAEYVAAVAGRK